MCHVRHTKKDPFEKSLISLSLTQLVKSIGYNFMYLQTYHKVPKLTTLVTFGFSCLRADVSYFLCCTRATKEIGDVCTQARI